MKRDARGFRAKTMGFMLAGVAWVFIPQGVLATESAPSEETTSELLETQPAPVQEKARDKFRFSGELRQETAFRLNSPHNFTKIKNLVKLDFRYKFNEHFKIKIGGRAYYDAVYDLTNQYPIPVNNDMRWQVALRDAYLDITYPKWNIRLGHQQIVWGEALGRFFADVVNPKDFREFVLQPFEDIRIPIWAFDVQYNFIPNGTLELVASPDLQIDDIPLPGSEFAFFLPPPPPGVTQVILPQEKPTSNFSQWNGGVRVNYLTHGWDLTWFYFTSLERLPILYKNITLDPDTGKPVLGIRPRHPRVHQLGATFTKAIGPAVMHGEFVYCPVCFFNAEDVTQNEGVTQGQQLSYVLGVNYPIAGKVDLLAEFQQQAILSTSRPTSDDRLLSWISFRMETGFLDEKLVPEVLCAIGLNHPDVRVSPRLNFKVNPSVTLSWGADLFFGDRNQLYGEFRDHSRIYMNTRWEF